MVPQDDAGEEPVDQFSSVVPIHLFRHWRVSGYHTTLPTCGCSVLTHPSSSLKARFSSMSSAFIFCFCLLLCKGKFNIASVLMDAQQTFKLGVSLPCSISKYSCGGSKIRFNNCDYVQSLKSEILFHQKIRLFSLIFSLYT
jgi:hypothetical protein